MILGIDEVGRGCLAGPLCVAAVILGEGTDRSLLDDSKKLTLKKRETAALHIRHTSLAIGIGWASAQYIDRYGMSAALRHANEQAVSSIPADLYDEIILDGTVNYLPERNVTLLAKADSLIPAVSAASIIAKVARDRYMKIVSARFPEYGFASHVGYGTKAHMQAIASFGSTPLHRMSFAPLNQLPHRVTQKVVSESSGAHAERVASEYLEGRGYEILERNWKTKYCEIDIVAIKQATVHFVEVKYRSHDSSGRGLEYITNAKQRQMSFAAKMWAAQHATTLSMVLSAIELSGAEFQVTQFVENIH